MVYMDTDVLRVRLDGAYCIYCGELAGTWEHFPPKSYSLRGLVMPACQECNAFAGTDYPLDFSKRAELVKDKLRKKYRKNLKSIPWDDEEVSEIGRGLRRSIEIWRKQRKIAEQRIAWNAESYLASIDHTNAFARIFVEEDHSVKRRD